MSYTINGIKYDYDSTINQRIKEKFVEREVYCLVNTMVEYILSKSWEDRNAPFCYDDVKNFYMPKCPECESSYGFEEFAYAYKCMSCNTISIETSDSCPNCEDGMQEFEELTDVYKCQDCGHIVEDIDRLDREPQEIFQWFMVSDYLCGKLEEKGECVLSDESIWGRGCCGQAILLDHVISEICYDMEILEGQKYEWGVN